LIVYHSYSGFTLIVAMTLSTPLAAIAAHLLWPAFGQIVPGGGVAVEGSIAALVPSLLSMVRVGQAASLA